MRVKKDNLFIALVCGVILLLTGIDLIKKDSFFSEAENRILTEKPKFTWGEFWEGSYSAQYEQYITDQFVFRNNWILLKTYTDIYTAKKEINGVYRISKNTLIEQHLEENFEGKTEKQIDKLKELVKWCDGKYNLSIMIVPTADYIYRDKLPKYAPYFDQQIFLKQVREAVGESHFISVIEKLENHKEEYIYYRTDHHWTTLGAFYAYEKWAEKTGNVANTLESFERQEAADSFLGTLHAKVQIPMEGDSLEFFLPRKSNSCKVIYDFEQEESNSLYEKRFLNKKDKYSAFLNGNHAFIEIETEHKNGKGVVVIKDSYANCFIPFLTGHYEKIYVVDFRYYRGSLENILKEYKAEDILVLFNTVHFIEEFRF